MIFTIEERGAFTHPVDFWRLRWFGCGYWSLKDLLPKHGQAEGSYAILNLWLGESCVFQGRLVRR